MIPTSRVTGLILAGGLARRMGGGDKGLRLFRGRPMVAHAIERLAPQVDALLINANQNRESYAALGYPVIADVIDGYAGPLAGLHAGLSTCTTPLLTTVPCDAPFLPFDLVAKLRAALELDAAQVAVARAGGWNQPVFALCRREIVDGLGTFLAAGGRKVDSWYATLKVVEVPFPDETAFTNLNTPEDLERLENQ